MREEVASFTKTYGVDESKWAKTSTLTSYPLDIIFIFFN